MDNGHERGNTCPPKNKQVTHVQMLKVSEKFKFARALEVSKIQNCAVKILESTRVSWTWATRASK